MGVRVLHAFLRVSLPVLRWLLFLMFHPYIHPFKRMSIRTIEKNPSDRMPMKDGSKARMQQSQEYLSLAQLRPIAFIPLIAIGLSHTRKEDRHRRIVIVVSNRSNQ